MGLSERDNKLSQLVANEVTPILVAIHQHRMNKEQCFNRVTEDMATICLLIVEGHLVLKHKEGGTANDLIRAFKIKNRQEDSSAQDKEPQDES